MQTLTIGYRLQKVNYDHLWIHDIVHSEIKFVSAVTAGIQTEGLLL